MNRILWLTTRYLIVITYLVLSFVPAFGQPDPADAKEHFKNNNYLAAMKVYKKLIKGEPRNAEYLHRLGQCYLRTEVDKTLALEYLEKAAAQSKTAPDLNYDLGLAYMHSYDFASALKAFKAYKASGAAKADRLLRLDKRIADCESAKQLLSFPLDITWENLGPQINTPFPDYYPYISKDGEVLVFTSRRKANKGGPPEFDGYYSSDIWLVESLEDGLTPARNFGSPNSSGDEQAVGISDDGKTVFVYVDRIDPKMVGDIYSSTFREKDLKYGRIKPLTENVNSKSFEAAASMSSDEQTLFFSSNRPGGYGGLDLWMSRKLPTGEWALPQNLGPEINTALDEDFPTLSTDNKTLYFASEGWPGMGGFDIYSCTWNSKKNTFTPPTNIGYPVNTPADNLTYSVTSDGKSAYVSALRSEGLGDLDIYKITYNQVEARPAIFVFKCATGDTAAPYATDVFVSCFNEAGDEVGSYVANQETGKFIVVLMPGTYSMEVDAAGYDLKTMDLKVTEFHRRMGETSKVIDLTTQ